MAMTINLTLLFQVAHFLIAYALITRLFLKPGYLALKEDENRMRQLKGALIEEQERLAQKELYKKERWRVCQNYFSVHRPPIIEERGGLRSTEAVAPLGDLTSEQLAKTAQDVSKKLKERLIND